MHALTFLISIMISTSAQAQQHAPLRIKLKGNAVEEKRLRDDAKAKAKQAELDAIRAARSERYKEIGRKWAPPG